MSCLTSKSSELHIYALLYACIFTIIFQGAANGACLAFKERAWGGRNFEQYAIVKPMDDWFIMAHQCTCKGMTYGQDLSQQNPLVFLISSLFLHPPAHPSAAQPLSYT
jgi:hypothetical protein